MYKCYRRKTANKQCVYVIEFKVLHSQVIPVCSVSTITTHTTAFKEFLLSDKLHYVWSFKLQILLLLLKLFIILIPHFSGSLKFHIHLSDWNFKWHIFYVKRWYSLKYILSYFLITLHPTKKKIYLYHAYE